MAIQFRLCICALTIATLSIRPSWAQTGETHEVQHLHPPKVAPAADEKKPEIAKAVEIIIKKTNDFREHEGKRAVKVNEKLTKTAQYFADYMARTDRYGHNADDEGPGARARKHGYDYCIILENIAYSYDSRGFSTQELGDGFFRGWLESPGHRRNMLDADVSETGVAIARSEHTGYYYAVQMFGRPKSDAVEFQIANRSKAVVHYKVGDQKFDLEPNYIRSHTSCRPPELTIELNQGESKTEPEKVTRKPVNGDHFGIIEQSGRLVLEKE